MDLDNPNSRFMETESVPRLLARFAIPSTIGMLASALYNIVDRIFVGQTVGADGIAAIALGFPCMLFFFAFSMLVGIGGASRVALQLGAKNDEGANQTVGNVVFLCILGGVLFMTIGQSSVDLVLRACGASDTLLPMAKDYLSVILLGVFFSLISFAGSCVIRACGSPNYAMGTQLIGALLNVALDAWFVIGLRMEVRGAAIATVISQGISMIWVTAYFFTPTTRIRLRWHDIFKPRREAAARILAVGTPPFLVHMILVIINGLLNSSVAKYGGDLAVAATGILMSLDSLLFMPAIAIGEGAQPIVGYNYGARRFERVRQTIKWSVGVTTAFYVISFLVIFFHAEFLVLMFNKSNEALITLTARFMRVAYLCIPVMGVSIITGSTLQGLGRARDGLILSFMRFGLFLLVPMAILPRFYGLFGVWATFPLSDVIGSSVSFMYLRRIMTEMKQNLSR